MAFWESIWLAFSKYFQFSGRSSRAEFWHFTLFYAIIVVFAIVIDDAVSGGKEDFFVDIWSFVTLIPTFSLIVRRLHDMDKSGWWFLLGFLPFLGWIVLLFWFLWPGTDGPNRFGNDPLEEDQPDRFGSRYRSEW